jgi:transposase
MTQKQSNHPQWALKHKRAGTELKKINGRFYLYAVKSEYSKELKKTKKISLGIIGSITEKDGFIPSDKATLKQSAHANVPIKKLYALEYGFSSWLLKTLDSERILERLKAQFPTLWQYIIAMVYSRILYHSPLKNIPFHLSNSSLVEMLDVGSFSEKQISENLRLLGSSRKEIQEYQQQKDKTFSCVLMDATQIISQSKNIDLAQQGYNSHMDYQTQFTLLYIYDAKSLKPLFYRLVPGNIREVTAMKNTLLESGIDKCIFIGDKGFYSEDNQSELEKQNIPFIMPLRRNNKKIDYCLLDNIEVSDSYFKFQKNYIFHKGCNTKNTNINIYVNGQLKEQEKNDYLRRIETLPDEYSREKYLENLKSMGTIALIHNTQYDPQKVYEEYKERGEIEQLFDQLKNTLDANVSYMQNEDALQGWMFINHIAIQIIYVLYEKLKTTQLNKTQKANKKYSIQDTILHLSKIQKIIINDDKHYITELNPLTKKLLELLKISVT